MQYEKELIELMPMFKNLLKKMMWEFPAEIEDEEVFSRCIERIIEKVRSEDRIRNPKGYMTGVFKMTIRGMKRTERSRIDRERLYAADRPVETPPETAREIIEYLDQTSQGRTQDVWRGLKRNQGHVDATARQIGIHYQTAIYHRNKLKRIYGELLVANNF